VTFLGVGTLLFDDGETALLTDGFFSRPAFGDVVFKPIGPDPQVIKRSLDRAGIKRLAAVIPLHSHYDHAMDAPEVARLTGALLYGSESTKYIGLGWGLPEDRIRVFHDGQVLSFGRFEVKIILSRHTLTVPDVDRLDQPLVPPAPFGAYPVGGTYKVLIQHNGKRLLVSSSGGWINDQFKNVEADVVFLGIATPELYRGFFNFEINPDVAKEYWNQVVTATKARRVIPIHWDYFFRPLEQGLAPLPVPNVVAGLKFLADQGRATGVDVKCAPLWGKIDPFAGSRS
jgi:L-ascorbate metabolism protein UlaG (beta-lactamase superfamily)